MDFVVPMRDTPAVMKAAPAMVTNEVPVLATSSPQVDDDGSHRFDQDRLLSLG